MGCGIFPQSEATMIPASSQHIPTVREKKIANISHFRHFWILASSEEIILLPRYLHKENSSATTVFEKYNTFFLNICLFSSFLFQFALFTLLTSGGKSAVIKYDFCQQGQGKIFPLSLINKPHKYYKHKMTEQLQ